METRYYVVPTQTALDSSKLSAERLKESKPGPPQLAVGVGGVWKKTSESYKADLTSSDLLSQLLANRGVTTKHEADIFLQPKYKNIRQTVSRQPILNIKVACDLIMERVKGKRLIIIFGDYDVDGVCSSSLLMEAITKIGGQVKVMLPQRETDGYGLQVGVINKILEKKPGLVITVDNGSHSQAAISELAKSGIKTVVVDHHEVGPTLPDAVVVNPKQDGESTDFSELCATGLAFRLAEQIYRESKVIDGQEKWLLDLVALATVCDMVPLRRDNRALVFFGLKTLKKTRRPGLIWLLDKLKTDAEITTDTIGFGIGPRLNAAGRLENANRAFELLNAKDVAAAAQAGEKLEELNQRRRAITSKVYKQALAKAEQQSSSASIVVADKNWPQGVCGLVAGRLAEHFNRPVFVLQEGQPTVGSGRSVAGFDLAAALQEMFNLFIRAGGHAMAAGCTLDPANTDRFRQTLKKQVETGRGKIVPARVIKYELEMDLSQLDNDYLDLKHSLAPFGVGNPEPVVRIDNCQIADLKYVGRDSSHVSLKLTQLGATRRGIAFSQAKKFETLHTEDQINILGYVKENIWQGVRSAQLEIVDIMKV